MTELILFFTFANWPVTHATCKPNKKKKLSRFVMFVSSYNFAAKSMDIADFILERVPGSAS